MSDEVAVVPLLLVAKIKHKVKANISPKNWT